MINFAKVKREEIIALSGVLFNSTTTDPCECMIDGVRFTGFRNSNSQTWIANNLNPGAKRVTSGLQTIRTEVEMHLFLMANLDV